MKLVRNEDSLIIEADEDITAANTEQLRQEILKEIDDSLNKITFNLAEVVLIDSSGISLLISIQNTLKDKLEKLQLVNTSDDLKRMFKLMRLDRHFSVC